MDRESKWAGAMLAAGILLRLIVYLFLAPLNNDDHLEVVRYLVEHGRFATLWDTLQAQHPPLYYLLAAPLWKWTGSDKAVQALSLVFSIATLLVLYHIVFRTGMIRETRARLYGFPMVCFLPQFVMFGLYLSNDALAFLLGNLAILQAWRVAKRPDTGRIAGLALLCALGLLTKVTFHAFLPAF